MIESAATEIPTSAFRGCSAYVRQAKPGDSGFFIIRVSGQETPEVSIHLFKGDDEMNVALAVDRLRVRKHSPHQNMESR
jgi:hypothetical protein